jgi:hypothetical protein
METIVSVEVDGKKIELYQSEGDSRDWDNYTKLICFHGSYHLGDKHEYNHNDYDGWDEMEQAILRKEKDVVWISPLYLYDHSGITISTSPFSCPWDSGQVGFAIVTKRDIRKLQGCKRVTKDIIAKVGNWAESEIKTYDQELCGEVYGFSIEDSDGEVEDSCGGFYGSDLNENGMGDYLEQEQIDALTNAW